MPFKAAPSSDYLSDLYDKSAISFSLTSNFSINSWIRLSFSSRSYFVKLNYCSFISLIFFNASARSSAIFFSFSIASYKSFDFSESGPSLSSGDSCFYSKVSYKALNILSCSYNAVFYFFKELSSRLYCSSLTPDRALLSVFPALPDISLRL